MLVVQSSTLNRSRLPTVMLCPMTSNLRLAEFPDNVLVKSGESDLSRDSVVLVCQIMTVDRRDLGERAGQVPPHLMLAVDQGLGTSLELTR